jgi:hypothetical protein
MTRAIVTVTRYQITRPRARTAGGARRAADHVIVRELNGNAVSDGRRADESRRIGTYIIALDQIII